MAERWYWCGLLGLIGGLSILFLVFSEKVVPPWDPTSMVVLGQSLAQNQSLQYLDPNNTEIGPYFNPHGFDIRAPTDPKPYSTFPPGFSILVALIYKLNGSIDLLNSVLSMLSAIGLAAVAYLGYVLSGRWGSLFAILLFGASHVVVTFSTSLWSDGPSLNLLLAGMALSIWAVRSKRRLAAVVAGICLGLFILFKFVNVVFVGLIIGGLVVFGRRDTRWVGWWLFPGIMLGVAGMLIYQAIAYGSPWATAYQPWGQSLYNFPLFSPAYLFFRAPAPWNDVSNNAILSGMLTDMHIWIVLFFGGLMIDRKNSLRLLLALIVLVNVGLYAVSVFSPRQPINMRYLLPALAAAYILAASVLARLMQLLPARILRVGLVGLVGAICLGSLLFITLPDLTQRNAGTTLAIQQVEATAQTLPRHSVVLAYSLADSFILYGNLSVLNYRRINAPDVNTRNMIVMQALDKMLCRGYSVYLVRDDDGQFNSIYPNLAQNYILKPNHTPIASYEIQLDPGNRRCAQLDRTAL